MAALDISAHEFGHGINEFSMNKKLILFRKMVDHSVIAKISQY
jgi:hypothetical protein